MFMRHSLLRLSARKCTNLYTHPIVRQFGYSFKSQVNAIGSAQFSPDKSTDRVTDKRGDATLNLEPEFGAGRTLANTKKTRPSIDSEKASNTSSRVSSDYDDDKLRQIIETSNMSAARQVEREQQKKQLEFRNQQNKTEPQKADSDLERSKRAILLGSSVKDGTDILAEKATPDVSSGNRVEADFKLLPNDESPGIRAAHITNSSETKSQDRSSMKAKTFELNSILKGAHQIIHKQQTHIVSWATAKWKHAQFSLQNVGKSLNDATGYSEIEKHKVLVERVENEIEQAREAVKTSKLEYEQAIQNRSDSQKEINELLTRKHTWSPQDVERFTELYKNDHKNMTDEVTCKQCLDEAEQKVEAVQIKLTASILTRYHEEQMWSDKIRQASTWGTWMLMGVNIALFATATFFVEPWKRRKLVFAFQTEVQQKMDEYSTQLQSLSQILSSDSITAASGSRKTIPGHELVKEDSKSHRISFFTIDSWSALKTWILCFVDVMKMPGNANFTMGKADLAVFSGMLVALGWLFGSLVNAVLFRR